MLGIDLFSGAGGLSLGAQLAGIEVKIAIESDSIAAKTYQLNHPKTTVINEDIRNVSDISLNTLDGDHTILFGGPPCQGYSTSNQRTRNKENPMNWLFEEYVRIARMIRPEWLVLENVKGIKETENGFFVNKIVQSLTELGYTCSCMVLCASNYGIPQTRTRFFLIGSIHGKKVSPPPACVSKVTVKDAIEDLPSLFNGANKDILPYKSEATSNYARHLRNNLSFCSGNLVTKNSEIVLNRYRYIPQGGNWKDIPDALMENYKDKTRCHTGIYRRLSYDKPSITVGNFRKSMLIHPVENRGLSIREAARLQSFPDSYVFCGSIGFQQQQVGNAVPPYLAKAVFQEILKVDSED